MSSLSHNDRSEDLGGGKGNFQDSTKDAIANSRVYTPSLHRDTVPRFSANTATPPSSAARHSEIVSEMLSGQDDNARDIEINKEKLRPQNEVPTHYQAHPYNVKSNTLGSKPSHHVQVEELPTTEEPSGSSVGVGSLPGDIHEAGVATLPEEREKGKSFGTFRTGFEDYSPAQGGLHSRTKAEEGLTGSEYGDTLKDHHLVHEHVKGAAEHHVGSKWEMPSTETPSGARQGVGSLPGKRSEQSVCLLPEERLFPADEILDSHLPPRMDEMPSMEHPSGSVVGVGSLPGKHSEQGVAMTPEERLFPADEILGSHLPPRADQLPSTEKISGSVVGVGSLPGKRSEQGVALTPEERLHPADDILMSHLPPRMDEMPSMEHPSGSIVGVGSLPGDRNEVAVCLMPEERLHPANDILMSHLPPRMDQMPSMEHPSGSIVGVGSLPGQRNEKGVAILPDERKEMGLDKPHRRSSYHRKPSHEPAHEKSQGSSREQKSHQGSGHEQKSGSGHDQKRTLHSERDAHRIGTHPSHYNHHRARGKHGGDHKMREIEQKLGLGTNEDENEMSRRAPSEVGSAGGRAPLN